MCCIVLLCRVGYLTVEYCTQVVANYTRAHIPLETFILDHQYSDNNMAFTINETGYPLKDFRAFVDMLHSRGQRWVCSHLLKCHCVNCQQSSLLML